MLINCPKCGFSQPSDQYCAQCGIDMQTFTPPKKPTLTVLFQSTLFQVLLLVIFALSGALYIMQGEKPQQWVQKISRFQVLPKNESVKSKLVETQTDDETESALQEEIARAHLSSSESSSFAQNADQKLQELKNKEIQVGGSNSTPTEGSVNTLGAGAALASDTNSENNNQIFKLTFAEISTSTLSRWINESSNLGLYQSLTDYSAGILFDFKKRNESYLQTLKTAQIKLTTGSTNSNLSGTMNDDGSQLLGLIAAVDYKSNENDLIQGVLTISKNSRQGSDVYPSNFELPKGAAFFVIGLVKQDSFLSDRTRLVMPPFQIFKSPDFMTHKTEFVIILEPEYK